jgi:hypothetical protein
VVGLSKSPENDCFPEYNEPIARIPRWLKEASVAEVEGSTPAKTFGGQVQTHHQTRPTITPTKIHSQIGMTQELEEAGGCFGGASVKTQVQAMEKGAMDSDTPTISVLPKSLQNPMKSGMKALNGGCESEGDGSSSLHVRVDLQDIKKCLTDIRGQVDLGLKRVEVAFQMLEQRKRMGREEKARELGFGERNSQVRQRKGHKSNTEVVGWYKPKKKKNRKNNKNQMGLLGPKPNKAPVKVSQSPRPTRSFPYRLLTRHLVQQPCQAGKTSEMRAARSTEVNGMMFAGDNSDEQPLVPKSLN